MASTRLQMTVRRPVHRLEPSKPCPNHGKMNNKESKKKKQCNPHRARAFSTKRSCSLQLLPFAACTWSRPGLQCAGGTWTRAPPRTTQCSRRAPCRLGLVVATVRRRGKQQDMSVTSPTFRNSSRYSTLTLSTLFATRAASNNAVFSVAKCSNVCRGPTQRQPRISQAKLEASPHHRQVQQSVGDRCGAQRIAVNPDYNVCNVLLERFDDGGCPVLGLGERVNRLMIFRPIWRFILLCRL